MDMNTTPLTGNYHLNNTHNIQPNANTYYIEKKYVSIHSEDRNILMYPKSGDFQINLPQTLNNVIKVRAVTYDFPSNYDVFSRDRDNVQLAITMGDPHAPSILTPGYYGSLRKAIYQTLLSIQNTMFIVTITNGFYTPQQMVTELTNRLNKLISDQLQIYVNAHLVEYSGLLPITDSAYNRFVVIYNEVQQNIWFGNTADPFTLNNSNIYLVSQGNASVQCKQKILSNFSDWGLPSNLGLYRADAVSKSAPYVRIYYGEITPGDDGYWLLPNTILGNNLVYYVECPNKINLMGYSNFYLTISKFNILDTTIPFSVNSNISVNSNNNINKPNGIVNLALAKIPIPTTPVTQWFGQNAENSPYAYFTPPLDKVSQLDIKLKYHDGSIVDFQNFGFSFMLEFEILQPHILRKGRYITADQGLVNLQPPI